ncbi:hypothetical protein COU88_00325 [Candidatus Roizmanbacteria bacterium CG10_big_fil_rev_8_21_14_0_10_39_6]|uniref:DUF5673 domain-containing protein n=1 Tax=Candidatus Roizmanbacteria bacterium CG10_big_fil_rev_8_21_14_0_10_39_6 TaxID=1974853 RepID=A0A2M8KTN2_9BACT|nr:MAG: hypothetical protein COU88_00325 [Candidatus Roizmanbacteria bacterium CG10_big_fil_rev_8_21_14_0_10_39_6]
MLNSQNNKKIRAIEWDAPTHAYKKKSPRVIKLLIVLGVVLSLLFLFITEYVLIIGVWAVLFVYYLRITTPPSSGKHKVSDFGVYWYGDIIPFSHIHAFSISEEKEEWILRLYNNGNSLSSVSLLLPQNEKEREQIQSLLEEYVPGLEKPIDTDMEKLARFFSRLLNIN